MEKIYRKSNRYKKTEEFELAKKYSIGSITKKKEYGKTYENERYPVRKFIKRVNDKALLISDERTLAYDSPTGKAYIGIAKKPLQEVKNGFGYYGVLIQTDNRTLIQCHECGKWFGQITQPHLEKHKLNRESYNKKFGLLSGTKLVSDSISYIRELIAQKNNANRTYNPLEAYNKKERKKIEYKKFIGTAEHDNRNAMCEKQLGYRIIEYIRKYKSLPSSWQKGEGDILTHALTRRYKNLQNAFKHYQLPYITRRGSNATITAPNLKSLEFTYGKNYNKEEIYKFMCDNTPSLKPGIANIFKD